MPLSQIKIEVLQWLKSFNTSIEIVGDHNVDWKIFLNLVGEDINQLDIKFINMIDLFSVKLTHKIMSSNLSDKKLKEEIDKVNIFLNDILKNWFEKHGKIAHHALDDALCNKDAYFLTMKLIEQIN